MAQSSKFHMFNLNKSYPDALDAKLVSEKNAIYNHKMSTVLSF